MYHDVCMHIVFNTILCVLISKPSNHSFILQLILFLIFNRGF